MAVEILARDFGIPIHDISGIDIAYDVHLRRVFLRAGLAEHDDVTHMVNVARTLHPERPGALDLPAWDMGRVVQTHQPRLPGLPAQPGLPAPDRQGRLSTRHLTSAFGAHSARSVPIECAPSPGSLPCRTADLRSRTGSGTCGVRTQSALGLSD